MDWIAEVDRLDKLLYSEGVPDVPRMRAVSQYADMLAQAEKAMRDAAAKRSELSVFVQKCRQIGTSEAARDAGITPRAARKRITRWYKNGTTKA